MLFCLVHINPTGRQNHGLGMVGQELLLLVRRDDKDSIKLLPVVPFFATGAVQGFLHFRTCLVIVDLSSCTHLPLLLVEALGQHTVEVPLFFLFHAAECKEAFF